MSNDPIEVQCLDWLRHLQMPTGNGATRGWIRSVRAQKDIQGKELARRMLVSPARVSVLEKDELRGAVTLKMMQKVADALDCRFVYAFVPKTNSQQAKPRIRLNSGHMKEASDRQRYDLQRQYEHSLLKTDDN
jgi:predicted DNA-binding mobile mystery protein A